MIHPHTELRYINEQIGFGVFATELIPKGTITWAFDDLDQVLDPLFVHSLDSHRCDLVKKYSYRDSKGKYVLCWDIGRYVNHSFHANCIGAAYNFDIAVRDITRGEELTNEYGMLNIEEPLICSPEEGAERSCVFPDDILTYYKEWDKLALDALQNYYSVNQPLAHLIPEEYKKKVKFAAEKGILLDSVLSEYFRG